MSTLGSDIRYACRAAKQYPAVTLPILVSLTLGLGFNTAIFSVFYTVLLQPLPYAGSERLVTLWSSNREVARRLQNFAALSNLLPISEPDVRDWMAQSAAFEAAALHKEQRFNIDSAGDPRQVAGARVQPEFFRLLNAVPARGTLTFPERAEDVAVIGHALWRSHFSGRADIIGDNISLDNRKYTVIGVAPPGVDFPRQAEIWTPLQVTRELQDRERRGFQAIARLKPGVTAEQAQAQLATVAARLQSAYPNTNQGWNAHAVPLRDWLVGDTRRILTILIWAVTFVTAIASANVAGLLLGRGAARSRELAIRRSLGASSSAIVRLIMTESAMLALVGAIAGVGLAAALIRLGRNVFPEVLFRGDEIGLNIPVAVYTAGIALLAALAAGLMPSLAAVRSNMGAGLQEGRHISGGRSQGRLRNAAAGVQLAVAVVLLVGAGLMISTLRALNSVDIGAEIGGVTVASFNFAPYRYTEDRRLAFVKDLAARAKAFGVDAVGVVDRLPFGGGSSLAAVQPEGRPDLAGASAPMVNLKSVNGGYFRALRIPLLQGRLFDQRDGRDAAPVAVVNETFAQQYWPEESAIGKRLKRSAKVLQVVGVVHDVRHAGLDKEAGAEMYVPLAQAPALRAHLMFRPTPGAVLTPEAVRQLIRSVDKEQAVEKIQTLQEVVNRSFGGRRILGALLLLFGAVAFVLTVVGVYGSVLWSVAQRRQEIGLRMALGADRGRVLMLFLRSSLVVAGPAICAGLAGAAILSRALTSQLYGVSPLDALTFAAAPAAMLVSVVIATWLPVRRAAAAEPISSLRES